MPMRRYERDYQSQPEPDKEEPAEEPMTNPVHADITVNPASMPLHPDGGEPSDPTVPSAGLCYPSEPYKAPAVMSRRAPAVRRVYRKKAVKRPKGAGNR
jgi:hypothetical protein